MIVKQNGQDQIINYPSSVLKISGLLDSELNQRNLMKEIAEVTKITPNDRKKKLDEFVKSLTNNQESKSFLVQWGVEIEKSLRLKGHVINPPVLQVSNKKGDSFVDYPLNNSLSYQQIWHKYGMCQRVTLRNSLLIVAPESNKKDMNYFINCLTQYSYEIGLSLPQINQSEHILYVNNTHPNDYYQEIAKYLDKCQQDYLPTFVICLIPGKDKKRYDEIKNFLSVQLGVLSQFIQTSKIFSNNQRGRATPIIVNIAVQIASKLGGIPSKVKIPLKSTMVIGLSLSNSKIRGTSPICAGICSYDFNLVSFYSNSHCLQRGEIIIPEDFIQDLVEKGLNKFFRENEAYPKNIIVYRDGVSYLQMHNLRETEVKSIVEITKKVTCSDKTSIVYMVAQKHTSIRIMKENRNGTVGNAGAGTVITDEISSKDIAEFYMISHSVNQDNSTASPTRYTIIYHYPRFFNDNQLIELTHFQTLQYPNWNGSIRIPACLMLSSKLADMVKNHLSSNTPKEFLNDKLHFL